MPQAVQHSWKAYEEYAWGFDELMPLNKSGVDSFGGMGATLIDSLDTLHMMGLTAEFKKYGKPSHFLSPACCACSPDNTAMQFMPRQERRLTRGANTGLEC